MKARGVVGAHRAAGVKVREGGAAGEAEGGQRGAVDGHGGEGGAGVDGEGAQLREIVHCGRAGGGERRGEAGSGSRAAGRSRAKNAPPSGSGPRGLWGREGSPRLWTPRAVKALRAPPWAAMVSSRTPLDPAQTARRTASDVSTDAERVRRRRPVHLRARPAWGGREGGGREGDVGAMRGATGGEELRDLQWGEGWGGAHHESGRGGALAEDERGFCGRLPDGAGEAVELLADAGDDGERLGVELQERFGDRDDGGEAGEATRVGHFTSVARHCVRA